MNLNNLSMNYKIILGLSTLTILTLIYQYIKNLLNPNKKLLEGQELTRDQIIDNRLGGDIRTGNNNRNLSLDSNHPAIIPAGYWILASDKKCRRIYFGELFCWSWV